MTVWQHNGLVHGRQGFRLAHPERPVLGRGYVQDTGAARRASDLCDIQGTVGRRGIVVYRGLYEWGRRQIFCCLTERATCAVQGMADY